MSQLPSHGPRGAAVNGYHISPAQFRPPRLNASMVEIDRIRAQLDDHPEDVTLLLGPPGCGKSTALLQHHERIRARDLDALWITLTEDDNESETLIRKLSLALSGPTSRAEWPVGLVEIPAPPSNTHLFIDGLELIQQRTARILIETFILNVPPGKGCYVTAHAVRSGLLHDARLRGLVHHIRHDQFRMTDDEASLLLGDSFTRAQVHELNRMVDGWAAGLRFLAHDPSAARRMLEFGIHSSIPVEMAHYFDDVVCAAMPADELAALMDASVLERFTAEAFANLPDQPCSWTFIEEQLRAGLFLHHLDDKRQWVAFHAAFGQHLREKLRRIHPNRFHALQRFAALWFQEHGHAMEAMRHASRLPDTKLATRIIEDVGGLLAELGNGPFMNAERPVPLRQASELPMVFLSQIYRQIRKGQLPEARQGFEHLRALTQDFTVFDCVNKGAVTGFARIIGMVLDVTEDRPVDSTRIALLEQMLSDYLSTEPVVAASVASLLSMAYVELSRYAEAATVCDIGLNAVRHLGPTKVAIFLRIQQANVALAQETVGKAILCIEDGWRLAKLEGDLGHYEVVATQIMRAELHYEANELDEALALVEPTLAHLPCIGSWVTLCNSAYSVAAAIAAIRHGLAAANEHLLAGESLARRRDLPRLAQFIAIARMRELTRAQDWKEATAWLEGPVFGDLLEGDCHSFSEVRIQVQALMEAARLMAEMGRPSDALAYLERVNKAYLDDSDVRQRFTFRILAMRTAFALRRYNAAVEHMLAAVGLAMQSGLLRRAITNRLALIEVFDWSVRNGRHTPPAIAAFIDEVLRGAGDLDDGAELLRRRPRRGPAVVTPNFALSPRETEILALVAEGYLTKEIAARLKISEGTVKSHRKKIREKLGVNSKSQAIARARELLIV